MDSWPYWSRQLTMRCCITGSDLLHSPNHGGETISGQWRHWCGQVLSFHAGWCQLYERSSTKQALPIPSSACAQAAEHVSPSGYRLKQLMPSQQTRSTTCRGKDDPST